ncbi:aminotransferase class III-fold pyridoxal phosphate-dependent enzyme [Streptomyces sp. NPDC048518]|uniref:aminotransferase family protein n=1 Tax=Streptomyces sp. NPDC048518 TaxID=3155029 RepID=UPI0033CFFF8D
MIDRDTYPLWNSPSMGAYLTTLSSENMLVEGRGVRVRDAAGRWFLDARSGLWNVTLGYDHPAVTEAVERQLHTLPFANLVGYGRPGAIAVEAAEALLPHLPVHMNKIRYCSNGSQAVETAMLLSRFLHHSGGDRERLAVFGMWRGYHGLGSGAGAVTGMSYVHDQSGPLLPQVHHVAGPFEGAAAPGDGLEQTITDYGPERVAAVVLELVVGEGGHVLSDAYLHSLERFCRGHGIHLIVDEVSTGMGRTGAFTRTEQVGIRPDILTLGKGLSAGYAPLSAVVLSDEVSARLFDLDFEQKFLVGSTNDGHPLALAASMAVIETLADGGVLDNVESMGALLQEGLLEVAARHPQVAAVRGTGLMQAVEIAVGEDGATAGGAVADHLRLALEERGVLVSSLAMVPAIMIIPPLVVTASDVEEIVTTLDKALADIRY